MNWKIVATVMIISIALMLIPAMASDNYSGIPNPYTITYTTVEGSLDTDPASAYDTWSCTMLQQVYEPLLMYNGTSTTSFIPMLAKYWPGYNNESDGRWPQPTPPIQGVSPPYTNETYKFEIRPNVPWQDSAYGYVNATDVVYSIQRDMLQDCLPQWLFYTPLTGAGQANSLDPMFHNSTENATAFDEYLLPWVEGAVQCNTTWVWFNLPAPYPSFPQILTQSWAFVTCKAWDIKQGCWNVGNYVNSTSPSNPTPHLHFVGDDNFTEFQRCWRPAELPLCNSALLASSEPMMGSGPYKLVQFNPDPNDGFQVYQSWSGYWQGQAPTPTCIIKAVPEWSNRKAEFLSTNPALQCDLTDVPEIDAPELTTNGSINGPLLPGLSLTEYNEMEADYMFFTYNMSWQSDYVPLLGTTPCPTLFSDRDLRLAFMYAFNSTQYLQQCWLGEATQPTTFMCNGTDYYNGSSAFLRNIDLAKAQYYLDLAWGGAVEKEGITVDLVYDNGTFRQTIATMLADTLMNRLNWTSGAIVNITTSSVSWPTYVGLFASSSLPVFCAGWSADYPDASDWAGPFMSPEGPWGTFQAITYGLNTTSLNADWPSPADYGPIPYLGSLGRWVTGLNGTYVDQLIDAATHAPTAAAANASYQELQDIFYAEAATLPTDQAIGRHYERDWIHGWVGGYSNNPIAVGPYFYQLWKALPTPETQVYGVDLNALDSITNTSEVYPLMQVVNVSMAAQREMVWHGSEAYINYTVHVRYENITGPVIYANIELKRTNVWTGEYYYVYIATERLENNTDYTFHVTWNETNSTQDGTWAISFCADPIGTTGGEVYPTNTSELEVNSTYEVMIGPPILGNLGSRVYNATSGVSQNEFGVFSGTIGPTDLSLFLQCYHGTAPAQWMYLADLGSRVNGVNTFFAYSAVIGPTDLSLFLQCYHGLGPS